MTHLRNLLVALILCLPATVACHGSAGTVVGRWQRTNQPLEWIQFEPDDTFTGHIYSDSSLVRGTFAQRGVTITMRSVYGHTGTLALRDGMLVMEDGTKYRRVK